MPKKTRVNPVRDSGDKEKIQSKQISNGVKLSRRNFLKLLLIGGGVLLLGKFLMPIINFFSRSGLDSKKEFKNFEVIDAGKEVIFRDIKGEDVLIIEKGAIK